MKYLLIIFCLLFVSLGWIIDINWNAVIEKDGLYYER